MPTWDSLLRCLASALLVSALLVQPSRGLAQDTEEEEEESEASDSAAPSAPVARTGSGAPIESWAAMAVALGVGAATIAVGAILGRFALDQNAVALNPATTQLSAQSLHNTASDFALASTVTLTIGAIIFGVGAVWAIVLPFSTPPGVAVRATISPASVGLEGTF